MHATDIAGYTYKAENLHPVCTIETMIDNREASPGARGMLPEDALDQIAGANAIDRTDENTYDSDDFPKVIFVSMLEPGETCGRCGEELF